MEKHPVKKKVTEYFLTPTKTKFRQNIFLNKISTFVRDFIFVDFFSVKVTGSDVKVGTLLVRNSVCNRERYDFLIISCICTITKGILASKRMNNVDV